MIDLLVKIHSEAEVKLYNALRDYHDAVVSTLSEGSCYVLSRELTVIVNPSCADDETLIETVKYLEKRTGIKFKSVVQKSLNLEANQNIILTSKTVTATKQMTSEEFFSKNGRKSFQDAKQALEKKRTCLNESLRTALTNTKGY